MLSLAGTAAVQLSSEATKILARERARLFGQTAPAGGAAHQARACTAAACGNLPGTASPGLLLQVPQPSTPERYAQPAPQAGQQPPARAVQVSPCAAHSRCTGSMHA